MEGKATEFQRFEEFRDALCLIGDEGSARRRVLSRCEVRDARRRLVDIVRLLFDVNLDSVVGRHCNRCRELRFGIGVDLVSDKSYECGLVIYSEYMRQERSWSAYDGRSKRALYDLIDEVKLAARLSIVHAH